MKGMRMQRKAPHLRASDDATGRVSSFVELGFDAQASCGLRVTDSFHDRLEGAEGTAANSS